MQITAELDSQHLEKLHTLERILKKTQSELIAFAIDEVFAKIPIKTEGQAAYELMQQSGFIGSIEDNGDLSENYKDYLDWSHKTTLRKTTDISEVIAFSNHSAGNIEEWHSDKEDEIWT